MAKAGVVRSAHHFEHVAAARSDDVLARVAKPLSESGLVGVAAAQTRRRPVVDVNDELGVSRVADPIRQTASPLVVGHASHPVINRLRPGPEPLSKGRLECEANGLPVDQAVLPLRTGSSATNFAISPESW